jgi:hypothetical protein
VACVLVLYSARSFDLILKNQALISDWIIVFLPIFIFRNLLSSPSTDIPAIFCAWFIFTKWLRIIERNESPWTIWPVLIILPVWIFMIKASSAALLLIPVGMGLLSIKEGNRYLVGRIGMVATLFLIPWLIQNWYLTGYGIFPIKLTALGSPEWQVPIGSIDQKFYLEQFGAFAPPKHYNLEWFKMWFSAHNKDTRIILILALSALVSGFVFLWRNNQQRVWVKVYFYTTILACLIAWLLTITEPRYGFGPLVFSALFPVAGVLFILNQKYSWVKYVLVILIIVQMLNGFKTLKELDFNPGMLIYPQSRPDVSYRTIQCGNFEGITPVEYKSKVPDGKPVFCWDCPFPCVPAEGIQDSLFIKRIEVNGKIGFEFDRE